MKEEIFVLPEVCKRCNYKDYDLPEKCMKCKKILPVIKLAKIGEA